MSSLEPSTACFLTTSKTAPVHLWDAFLGCHRASYIAKDNSDSVVAANSVAIDPDGSLIYAGYSNVVRILDIAYNYLINLHKTQEHRGPDLEMVILSSSSDEEDLESPPNYFEYTKQEEQCLAIVANFRRQFTDAYPDRKPLFLTPVNVGLFKNRITLFLYT